MNIRDMFLKDIERDIRGVIKVAQTSEADIYQELDEYVVTEELHRHLEKFYTNYLKGIDGRTDKMGVWISGFFGSGKSHFLKVLAYLLENKAVKGKQPMTFFKEKVNDVSLYEQMLETADVETEVILFNIDSKSSLDNKSKEDAILRVFMKVFYDHQGYYGDIPGVAEMEKYLDKQGVYQTFKDAFLELAGESWEKRRHAFYFDRDFVISALTKVTDMTEETAGNWFDRGVQHVEISIEKFAKDVKEYIDEKGPNFHIVFLVDEIGQYIGDSRQLMLNLQTLTEDLGTHAQGKVWIMVTSQESIDSIVKVKGDDFSRIQGRFDTRLSLSSISVDEVIMKRILEKKDYVSEKLQVLYREKSAILKNVISFRETTAGLRGFKDQHEFATVYPFVPYQFKLLQHVFEQVRKHGSSGKHLSEGERSMLSAFKESALRFKDAEEGVLIPFYAFYDTIKEFLHPSISRVIEGAYENPILKDDEFNIDLLKVLFMIKYSKELPGNIDNIATLMVTHMDEDKLSLKEKINERLQKLLSQTLIQKNGQEYIFLTDDEQDINREIKEFKLEDGKVEKELAAYIFQDLYDDRRFKYSTVYTFPYNRMMDEIQYGHQSAPIGLHVVSPLSGLYHQSDQELIMMTSGSGHMIVKLGGNEAYVEEMEEALKIEEYRKKKNITQLPEVIQNILNNKQVEMRERKNRVRMLLEDALQDATFFINGDKMDIKGSPVRKKINGAFKQLVDNIYTKLGYMGDHIENEQALLEQMKDPDQQVSLDNSGVNDLAKRELIDFIDLQADLHKQVRVKSLYDRFEAKPYGWKQLDIASLIVELLKEQRMTIRYHSQTVHVENDQKTLLTVLTKAEEADRAIVEKHRKVDPALIRTAKRICRDIFQKPNVSDDEYGLVKDILSLINEQVADIRSYEAKYSGLPYPGKSLLEKGLEHFSMLHDGLDHVTFFTRLKEMEDDLSFWEEDFLYVKSFFNTNQKEIFDQGHEALALYEENKAYLVGHDIDAVVQLLKKILNNPVPYRHIKDIPELVHRLGEIMEAILTEKRDHAKEKITLDQNELLLLASQTGVAPEVQKRVQQYYDELFRQLDSYLDIYKVDATISQSVSFKERIEHLIKKQFVEWKKEQNQNDQVEDEKIAPKQVLNEKVRVAKLVPMSTIETEEEVDQYVQTLAARLKQIIKANRRIEFID